jgi:DNA-binding NarL/FixJ family response regulator
VLQLLAEGRAIKEVADRLRVTTRTVAFHKYRSWNTSASQDERLELVQYALEHGMLKKRNSVRANTVSFDSIGDFQQRLY